MLGVRSISATDPEGGLLNLGFRIRCIREPSQTIQSIEPFSKLFPDINWLIDQQDHASLASSNDMVITNFGTKFFASMVDHIVEAFLKFYWPDNAKWEDEQEVRKFLFDYYIKLARTDENGAIIEPDGIENYHDSPDEFDYEEAKKPKAQIFQFAEFAKSKDLA